MTGRPVSEAEFAELLASPVWSAVHFEAQPWYALGYERAEFDRFLAGQPRPPAEVPWWQEWLEQISRLTAPPPGGRGVEIIRVRIDGDEHGDRPTAYQQWARWTEPWHTEAGERVLHMPRSRAIRAGLPLGADWWLIDDTIVIVTTFTSGGAISDKVLTDDPADVAAYRRWRDLAVQNAHPAEESTAA